MLQLRERANIGLHDYLFSWIRKQTWFRDTKSVLDIGCGSGAWLQRFSSNPAVKLVGVDLDVEQFRLANATVIQVDMDKHHEKHGSFDFISSLELIEHLENPGRLFSFVKLNLAAGGHWLISTPNIHSIAARLKFLTTGLLPHFDEKSDPTHIYPVYKKNLEKLVERHGFELVYSGSFPSKGYNNYGKPVQRAAALLNLFLPAIETGDNVFYLLKHKSQ